jgi:hypothetical protein
MNVIEESDVEVVATAETDEPEWEPRALNRAERRKQLRDARRAVGKINALRTRQDQALLIKIRHKANRLHGDPREANDLISYMVDSINQERAAQRSTVSA